MAEAHHLQGQVAAIAQHLDVVPPPQVLCAPSIHAGVGLITLHQGCRHFQGVTNGQQHLDRNVELIANLAPEWQQQAGAGILNRPWPFLS